MQAIRDDYRSIASQFQAYKLFNHWIDTKKMLKKLKSNWEFFVHKELARILTTDLMLWEDLFYVFLFHFKFYHLSFLRPPKHTDKQTN